MPEVQDQLATVLGRLRKLGATDDMCESVAEHWNDESDESVIADRRALLHASDGKLRRLIASARDLDPSVDAVVIDGRSARGGIVESGVAGHPGDGGPELVVPLTGDVAGDAFVAAGADGFTVPQLVAWIGDDEDRARAAWLHELSIVDKDPRRGVLDAVRRLGVDTSGFDAP